MGLKLKKAHKLKQTWKGIVTYGTGKYQNGLIFVCELQARLIGVTTLFGSEKALTIKPDIRKAAGVLETCTVQCPHQ